MNVPSILHNNVSHTGGVSEEDYLGHQLYYGSDETVKHTPTSGNASKDDERSDETDD